MPVLVVLTALAGLGLLALLGGKGRGDLPMRIATAAQPWLPAARRDWGQAIMAELGHVQAAGRRWQFALGVLRVALLPAPARRTRVLVVAGVGLSVTVTATVATALAASSLSVFVATLGVLLCGFAATATARWAPGLPGPARLTVGAVALAGIAATIATVVRISLAHPAATEDRTHVYSVLFAVALAGYLALALAGRPSPAVLWWGVGGALACTAIWVLRPATPVGVLALVSPVAAAATLLVSIGATIATRNRSAGVRAGMLTAILGAPIHLAVELTTLLGVRHYTLTDPYDIAAFPHSGYPDVASYLLSDALAWEILAGLVLLPVALLALAFLGGAAGTGLSRLTSASAPRTAS